MFYSHDLLGRKTPLGAIWTMAHGKKLSKTKILGIKVSDICKQILQPDVPHSLRLQGILIGGVVIVFTKQQTYLLEDLRDLRNRVRSASAPEAAAVAALHTVLQKGRDKARVEAITLEAADDDQMFLLPTDQLGRLQGRIQDLEDLDRLDPDGNPDEGDDPHRDGGLRQRYGGGNGNGNDLSQVDDLFMLQTLAATQSEREGTKHGSHSKHGASGSTDPPTRDHQELDEDLFEAPDLQLLFDADEEGEGDAYLLALGGLDVAAQDGSKKTSPLTGGTATDGTAAAAAGGRGGVGLYDNTQLDNVCFQEPDSGLMMLQDDTQDPERLQQGGAAAAAAVVRQERRRRRRGTESGSVAASEGVEEDEEMEGSEEEEEGAGPRRSASVVPFPSVGEPPEHFMPPSPVQEGEELFAGGAGAAGIAAAGGVTCSGLQPVPSMSEGGGISAGGLRGRKRRTSDEDNDSVSEASLLAVSEGLAAETQEQQEAEEAERMNAAAGDVAAVGAGKAQRRTRQQQLQGGSRGGVRRRAGARVTLDDLEETLVRGRTYREWTLDTRELLAPRRNRQGPLGGVGAAVHSPQAAGYSLVALTVGRSGGGAAAAVTGASMDAALTAALAARDADAAAAAVLRAPAAVMGGMGMGWAPQLVRLVAVAAAATKEDEIVDDGEAAVDGGRPKRQRTAKAAVAAAAAATASHDTSPQPSAEAGAVEQKSGPTDGSRLESEGDEQSRGDSGGRRAALGGQEEDDEQDNNNGPPLDLGMEEADMMGDMMPPPEDMFEGEDFEWERLRRDDTPNGSDAQRRMLQQQRAALGLTPGGSGSLAAAAAAAGGLATGGRSSRATTVSSQSLESENQRTVGAPSRRGAGGRESARFRFGTGALEDLLPGIEEAEGGADMMMMGFEEEEEEDAAGALPNTMRVSGGTSGDGSGAGPSRGRTRTHTNTLAATQTGTGAGTGTGMAGTFHLRETDGAGTQAPGQGFISRNTQTVISIFRRQLGILATQLPASDDADAGGSPAEPPGLSFFGLASRLQRNEAVKLFYQTLVTHNTGFIRATQEEAYGDITIRAGRYL